MKVCVWSTAQLKYTFGSCIYFCHEVYIRGGRILLQKLNFITGQEVVSRCYKMLSMREIRCFLWGMDWLTGVWLGVNYTNPIPRRKEIREPGPPDWANLKLETIKSGPESHGTWAQEGLHWWGPSATVNYRLIISSERAPHNKLANCLKKISRRTEN
jgi:hypothetical protein